MFANINILAVLACGVVGLVLGFVWYGPLFGKLWMHLCKMDELSEEEKLKMQKNAMKLYATQLLLTLFQAFVLAHFLGGFGAVTGIFGSLWIWAGFVLPTVATLSMWGNDSGKTAWVRFGITAGFQLVLFVMFGLILGIWY